MARTEMILLATAPSIRMSPPISFLLPVASIALRLAWQPTTAGMRLCHLSEHSEFLHISVGRWCHVCVCARTHTPKWKVCFFGQATLLESFMRNSWNIDLLKSSKSEHSHQNYALSHSSFSLTLSTTDKIKLAVSSHICAVLNITVNQVQYTFT